MGIMRIMQMFYVIKFKWNYPFIFWEIVNYSDGQLGFLGEAISE